MGPVHTDEKDHMKDTTVATEKLKDTVAADVKKMKEPPLNEMMKVA